MVKKENTEFLGRLCLFGKEIVLVVERYKHDSYNVLFPKGCIDCVGKKRLKVIS